jgi:hypothetical protein
MGRRRRGAYDFGRRFSGFGHFESSPSQQILEEGLGRLILARRRRRPDGMAEDEEAAYDTATEILRSKRVSDATYRSAVAKFGEQGVIDLLGVVGYYNFLAIVMNATRTALPGNVAEPLKRYPE